jgi:hypothetical protein
VTGVQTCALPISLLLESTECKHTANSECKRKRCEFIRKDGESRQRWREQAEKGAAEVSAVLKSSQKEKEVSSRKRRKVKSLEES